MSRLGLLFAGAILVACSSGLPSLGPSATADPWIDLRRPLVPAASADGACAYSNGRDAWRIPGAVGFDPDVRGYIAWGDGPVHPAFTAPTDEAILSFSEMPKDGDRAQHKVIWIVQPGYDGGLLIRAVTSDGLHRVTFRSGDELRLRVPSDDGGRTFPEGNVHFPAPGCYTFQIDGEDLTSKVVVWVRQ